MKNIQVIDGAMNSIFEIYAIRNDLFARLFPNGADIAFTRELPENLPGIEKLYARRVPKRKVKGIHGTLHLELSDGDPKFFPMRREINVINKGPQMRFLRR
jgi:hypothetical protein